MAVGAEEVAREVGRTSARLRKVTTYAERCRAARDALLVQCHEGGMSVADLARVLALSRQSVYAAIRRHREAEHGR